MGEQWRVLGPMSISSELLATYDSGPSLNSPNPSERVGLPRSCSRLRSPRRISTDNDFDPKFYRSEPRSGCRELESISRRKFQFRKRVTSEP